LANAHLDAAAGLPVVQIGMDTPQVRPEHLMRCTRDLDGHDAVLGMAHDGGWWVLGVRDAASAQCLRGVPMSVPDTGVLTLDALQRTGLQVSLTDELADVDTIDDIGAVRDVCPSTSRFHRITATVSAREA
jgi:glycosyltransferase A (GT-A) superfamily protein (DUF2064 family)